MSTTHAPNGGLRIRLSLTDRCQLRCRYCLPAQPRDGLPRERLLRPDEVLTLVSSLDRVFGVSRLRLTGGEPLLRRDAPELIEKLAAFAIPDIALTTNAQLLAGQAETLRRAGLRRVNISLDSLKPETFKRITPGASLARTLAGIDAALESGLAPVKLNTVVMRGINDGEILDLLGYGLAAGCEVRFLELMPIGAAARDFRKRFVSMREIRSVIETRHRLESPVVAPGETSVNYRVQTRHGAGVCGFISPTSQPFCEGCRRLRITADGQLVGCLARKQRVDVRPALASAVNGDLLPLKSRVLAALRAKHCPHAFAEQSLMASVGG